MSPAFVAIEHKVGPRWPLVSDSAQLACPTLLVECIRCINEQEPPFFFLMVRLPKALHCVNCAFQCRLRGQCRAGGCHRLLWLPCQEREEEIWRLLLRPSSPTPSGRTPWHLSKATTRSDISAWHASQWTAQEWCKFCCWRLQISAANAAEHECRFLPVRQCRDFNGLFGHVHIDKLGDLVMLWEEIWGPWTSERQGHQGAECLPLPFWLRV